MKRFFSARAYLIWLIAAMVVFLCSFAASGSLDIHQHDTYFVVAHRHVFQAVALALLLCAFLYRMLREALFSPVLNFIHILCTLLPLAFTLYPVSCEGFAGGPRRYYDSGARDTFRSFNGLNGLITLMVVLCAFAQVIFLLHILWGLVRLFRRRR